MHLLHQGAENEVQYDSFDQMMKLALVSASNDTDGSLRALSHFLHQDDGNEVQNDFLVMCHH